MGDACARILLAPSGSARHDWVGEASRLARGGGGRKESSKIAMKRRWPLIREASPLMPPSGTLSSLCFNPAYGFGKYLAPIRTRDRATRLSTYRVMARIYGGPQCHAQGTRLRCCEMQPSVEEGVNVHGHAFVWLRDGRVDDEVCGCLLGYNDCGAFSIVRSK